VSDAPTSRWSTHQLLPPTLVFLAALCATVAIAAPTILAPQLARISLDTNLVSTAASTTPVVTLDRCSLDRPMAAMLPPRMLLRSQRVVVVRPADRRIATLQAGTVVRRDATTTAGCTDPVLIASVDRVTVDRTTAVPVGPASIQTDSTRPAAVLPDRIGITYLFAPQSRRNTAVRFFDPVTRRSVPLVPTGTDTVNGLDLTRLRADIPDTNLAALPGADPRTRLTKPASWFGWPGGIVTAEVHQRGSYTLWVDERSGLIVDATISLSREYRAGAQRLPEFDATLRYDAKTRASLAEAARSQSRPAWLAGRIVPLIAGIAALCAAAGAWAIRRRPGRSA
jgi:hypothetical protein